VKATKIPGLILNLSSTSERKVMAKPLTTKAAKNPRRRAAKIQVFDFERRSDGGMVQLVEPAQKVAWQMQ